MKTSRRAVRGTLLMRRGMSAAILSLGASAPGLAIDKSWNAGSGTWSTAASWSPAGVPASTDVVRIGNTLSAENMSLYMDQNDTIGGLHVTDGMVLDFEGFWLNVNGNTTLSGANTIQFPDGYAVYSSGLRVEQVASSAAFATNNLTISDGAFFHLAADTSAVIRDGIQIGDGSFLTGGGLVSLEGTGTTFINDGSIMTRDMTLFNTQGGRFDLDGVSGDGQLHLASPEASVALLGAGLTDSFSSWILLGPDATLHVLLNDPWTLDVNSQLRVSGQDGELRPSTLSGSAVSLAGYVAIMGDVGALQVAATATIEPTAEMHIDAGGRVEFGRFGVSTTIEGGEFTIDEQGELEFIGPTTVRGGAFSTHDNLLAHGSVDFAGATTWDGTITVSGVARQLGDAIVSGATVINADVFDLDGNGANWTLNNGLTINAAAIDTAADPMQFNTAINVSSALMARLTINLSEPVYWNMAGQLTLAGPPLGFTTRVAGSTMYMSGDLNVSSGQVQISADTILAGTTTIPAGTTLRLAGYTQIYGWAEFAGAGNLRNDSTGQLSLYDGASLQDAGLINHGFLGLSLFPATASVARFENAAAGTWSVNIVGDAPGSGHDLLIVSDGSATLAGHLDVMHYDLGRPAFRPQVGDEYTILTALNGVSGAFAANPRSYSHGQKFDWTVLYGSNDVTLRVDAIGTCPAGDVDDDGDVDLQDLAILLANFGRASGAAWPDGDLDGDGDVELQDLATLLAHFGSICS